MLTLETQPLPLPLERQAPWIIAQVVGPHWVGPQCLRIMRAYPKAKANYLFWRKQTRFALGQVQRLNLGLERTLIQMYAATHTCTLLKANTLNLPALEQCLNAVAIFARQNRAEVHLAVPLNPTQLSSISALLESIFSARDIPIFLYLKGT